MGYISDISLNGTKCPTTNSLCGTCSTASSTAAKVVMCSSFDTLKTGVSIFVTFINDNTASNPTMNVNSTGAKAIKNGSSTDIKWSAGTTVQFMYDGTNWQQIGCAGGMTFNGEEIEVVAADQIKIGDVVYTVGKGSPWTDALSGGINSTTFSPDGTKLVLGGDFGGKAKLYSVSGNTITFVSNIYANVGTTALNATVYSAVFSPDGTKLVLGGWFTSYAKLYSVSSNSVTYLQDIYADAGTTALSNTVKSATFSPDGTKLVLGGDFSGRAKLYSVSGNTVTYLQDIYANTGTTALNSTVNSAIFSSDGTKLVLGGYFTGYAKLYSVSSNTISYIQDIYFNAGTTALDGAVWSAVFSPDGSTLVLGGDFSGYAKFYSVSSNTITYLQDIYADTGTTALDSYAYLATFSPNGTKLVLGGYFTSKAKFYSVSGNTITYLQDIYANAGTTTLDNIVYSATFSPDETKLVLGGWFTNCAKFYSVSSNTVTYLKDIYAGIGIIVLSNTVLSASFSPDGTKLVLGGGFTGRAKLYSVSGNTISYIQDIYSNAGTTALDSNVNSTTFSPDGTKLVLGGGFSGYAKLYSISGNTVTYLQDIYADTGTTALSSTVYSATFSPDGTKLVLGGKFSGYAKLYSVSGNTTTFVSNIYANAGTTALNYIVYTATFSPDGTKLVLGGDFTGRAKFYSVSSNTVTYLQDIYADAGTTALSNTVESATFSPDGSKLVLGGWFTNYAKFYSVSGSAITYIQNIYADAGTTALSSYVYSVAFSPDGTKLVLGGLFSGCAKFYSISGNTISYIQDIYSNVGTAALESTVRSTTFSPDGTKLVLGGQFSGCAKLYSVSGNTVTYLPYGDYTYKALSGFPDNFIALGLALNDVNPGATARINKLIGGYID